MVKYFENRQNPLKIDEEIIEAAFKSIADYFDLNWLKNLKGGHPLQQLWKRKDTLSTNELFFFGHCLKNLNTIDKNWTKGQVSKIKHGQSNNQIGAVFEINGIGLLAHSHQIIEPTKGNNPGFDAILKIDELKSMRISIKNYGDSLRYKDFKQKSLEVEIRIQQLLKLKGIQSIQIYIEALCYPSDLDWKWLLDSIPEIIDKYVSNSAQAFHVPGKWNFSYGILFNQGSTFSTEHNSYSIIILAPYHNNEEKNLLDKLDEACANLIRHSRTEDDQIINAVFVHLPELASIDQCKEWAIDYINVVNNKPISLIILYQPTVATNLNTRDTFLHNCFQLILKPESYNKWNSRGQEIKFELPTGEKDMNPAENLITFTKDGEMHKISLKKKYIFQKGNIYLEAMKDEKGTLTGNVRRIANGIIQHSVFKPFPDQASMVLSGQLPQEDKLILL